MEVQMDSFYSHTLPTLQELESLSLGLPKTLSETAVYILQTGDATLKRNYTLAAAYRWKGSLTQINNENDHFNSNYSTIIGECLAPTYPARPSNVKIVAPHQVPKRGKAGSLASRIAMVHSLVHIENMAIDLAWDIIARFTSYNMPKAFYDEFVKIAEDEARHYNMLNEHLKSMGSYYGALEAHAGLWDSALDSMHDLKARLAIEHIVQEGHGLDVTPKIIARFRSSGDPKSAQVLEVILRDEVTHVTAGLKWFKYLCERESLDAKECFYGMVGKHFRGVLKPPFNIEARRQAGMDEDWYLPLAQKQKNPSNQNIATKNNNTNNKQKNNNFHNNNNDSNPDNNNEIESHDNSTTT